MIPTISAVPDIYRILPEVVLTITGVLIMLLDAALPVPASRRPLGWVGAFGVMAALWACRLLSPASRVG